MYSSLRPSPRRRDRYPRCDSKNASVPILFNGRRDALPAVTFITDRTHLPILSALQHELTSVTVIGLLTRAPQFRVAAAALMANSFSASCPPAAPNANAPQINNRVAISLLRSSIRQYTVIYGINVDSRAFISPANVTMDGAMPAHFTRVSVETRQRRGNSSA